MRKGNIFLLLVCFMFGIYSTAFSQPVDSTSLGGGNITTTVNLNSGTKYIMKGFNYVKNGGKVVIQPGTIIYGDSSSRATLIIERGGKLIADGTASQPIVFTSRKGNQGGSLGRLPGDWGGIIILGRSGINTSSGADSAEIEGFGAGLGPIYGGQPRIDDDSSGVLRYVRIEFPGVNLTPTSGNEINGLTMGGVGSKTIIEHIQVSYCGDDSFEWFGGTVNCKWLISYKPIDDDWDTDNGFRGRVQFGLSVRDTSFHDQSTSNGFESDNNNNSPSNYNSPRTKPLFCNMTVIGPYINTGLTLHPDWNSRGGHLRRRTLTCIYNSIIMGWRVGMRLDECGVINAANGDTLQQRSNVYAGNVKLADTASNSGCTSFSTHAWLQTGAYNNTIFSTASSVQLNNPFGVYPYGPEGPIVNHWMPMAGSPVLTGANFTYPNISSGFDVVTYRGAFGGPGTNWTEAWAVFNPVTYIIGIQQISSQVPAKFSLEQNYPNPFNPVTNIKFAMPKAGFASITIYNTLGEVVTTLVNRQLNIGTYKVDFDGANLSSGAYFYRLNVKTENNFEWTESKKMMLVK